MKLQIGGIYTFKNRSGIIILINNISYIYIVNMNQYEYAHTSILKYVHSYIDKGYYFRTCSISSLDKNAKIDGFLGIISNENLNFIKNHSI